MLECVQAKNASATPSRYARCESWIESRLRMRAQMLRPQDAAFEQGVLNVHRTYVLLALEGSCSGAASSDAQAVAEAAHTVWPGPLAILPLVIRSSAKGRGQISAAVALFQTGHSMMHVWHE